MASADKKKLEKQYQQLMEESYKLSHSNRKMSDMKRGASEAIAARLDAMERDER